MDLFICSETAYLSINQITKEIDLHKLIMDFIQVFYDQLKQFPNDFFSDELSKNNFSVGLLKRLKEYSIGMEYASKIQKRIIKLLDMVQKRFNVDL